MLVVSLCCFLFFLSVLVNQISAVGNNKAPLKDQLERSIIHVSQILADVENKIGRERKILSQIDNALNEDRGLNRIDTDYGIDIFWNKTTPAGAIGQYGNYTYTIETTPSLFPTPQATSIFPTLPVNWHLSTQTHAANTDTLYIADLKKNMESKHYGFFSAFIDEGSELVFKKKISDSYKVVSILALLFQKDLKQGKFVNMGDDLIGIVTKLLNVFHTFTPDRVQQQAGVLHTIIQVKEKTMSEDWNNLIDYYDSMFTKEEGQDVFEALELFFIFPEANITLLRVGESIYQSVLSPYFKSEGTRKQRRLIQFLLMAAHDLDPYFRTQTEDFSAKGYNLGSILQGNPIRRSINYEKVVKHFLRKHPKLFKKIKRQYKHEKKNKHHHFSHKQKRHHKYLKSRGGHHKREHRHEHEKTKQGTHLDSNNKLANEEITKYSIKSGAYYGENREAYPQKLIQNIQFTQIPIKLPDRLKQRRQMPLEVKPALSTVEYLDVDQADPQYLKQLAIRFLRNKPQSQNFNRYRRLNIPSSEEDICDHSQYLEDSIKNDKLHKIREASSYSDEEEHLTMNLYDALRHGNRTFMSFRRSNGDVINKQTLRESSSHDDDEWVLKNNIYKVFEKEQ